MRTTRLDEVNEVARGVLRLHGGLMREDNLISIVLKRIVGSSDVDGAVLRLSFSIDSELHEGSRSLSFVPFWRLESLAMEDVTTLVNAMVKILGAPHLYDAR